MGGGAGPGVPPGDGAGVAVVAAERGRGCVLL